MKGHGRVSEREWERECNRMGAGVKENGSGSEREWERE